MKAGEQVLLPSVREASPHALILTDGFSCRSQIEHGSQRSSLHLAQAVQMGMREGPNGPANPLPESGYTRSPEPSANFGPRQATLAAGAAATLGGIGVLATRRLRSR